MSTLLCWLINFKQDNMTSIFISGAFKSHRNLIENPFSQVSTNSQTIGAIVGCTELYRSVL